MRVRAAYPAGLVLLCLLLTGAMRPDDGSAKRLQAALGLPPGFVAETVVDSLRSPRAFAFAPDGRILIAERGNAVSGDINFATVRVVKAGALLPPSTEHWLTVCGDGERGLLGLALDPQFASNGLLYVYYTRQGTASPCGYNQGAAGPRNRVSRLTLVGDTVAPGSERVLIDNIPSDGGVHNAGDLRFDGTGNLLITTGNANLPDNPAQQLDRLGGKLLRIRPDSAQPTGYSIPADNPFVAVAGAHRCGTTPPENGAGPCQEIYAYGLRNPFRTTIHPQRGEIYAFDVGGGGWEEIDLIVPGANYGHPNREGPCDSGSLCLPDDEFFGPATSAQGYSDPLYAYKHSAFQGSSDAAIIGGAFYSGTSYPAAYSDNLFFGDFVRGWVRRLVRDPSSGSWSRADFATGAVGLVGIQAGPDTNIYLLLYTGEDSSELVRIRYSAGVNQPPTARISANPLSGPLSTRFDFSGAASTDPEGDSLRFRWELGDGTTAETTAPTLGHSYSTTGAKLVTLRVVDDGTPPAISPPATVTVFPGNQPPTATISLANLIDPGRADSYYAGDSWRFTATNLGDDQTDPAALALVWSVVFHHREHTHPFIEQALGATGSFTIPTIGEHDPVVWYRVSLHVTDGDGQTTVLARNLFPATATLSFDTGPSGGRLQLDGQDVTTPLTLTRVVGLESLVAAPDQQTLAGNRYQFWRWSHGAAKTFSLRTPAVGGHYTASYHPLGQTEQRVMLPLIRR